MSSVSKILKYESIPLEEKLFIIQFPRVSTTCITYGMTREVLYELWDYVQFIFKDRNEFELAVQMILAKLMYVGSLDELKQGSRIEWYYNKFLSVGVEFEINNNGVNIIIH